MQKLAERVGFPRRHLEQVVAKPGSYPCGSSSSLTFVREKGTPSQISYEDFLNRGPSTHQERSLNAKFNDKFFVLILP
jgi:hypothetical protein